MLAEDRSTRKRPQLKSTKTSPKVKRTSKVVHGYMSNLKLSKAVAHDQTDRAIQQAFMIDKEFALIHPRYGVLSDMLNVQSDLIEYICSLDGMECIASNSFPFEPICMYNSEVDPKDPIGGTIPFTKQVQERIWDKQFTITAIKCRQQEHTRLKYPPPPGLKDIELILVIVNRGDYPREHVALRKDGEGKKLGFPDVMDGVERNVDFFIMRTAVDPNEGKPVLHHIKFNEEAGATKRLTEDTLFNAGPSFIHLQGFVPGKKIMPYVMLYEPCAAPQELPQSNHPSASNFIITSELPSPKGSFKHGVYFGVSTLSIVHIRDETERSPFMRAIVDDDCTCEMKTMSLYTALDESGSVRFTETTKEMNERGVGVMKFSPFNIDILKSIQPANDQLNNLRFLGHQLLRRQQIHMYVSGAPQKCVVHVILEGPPDHPNRVEEQTRIDTLTTFSNTLFTREIAKGKESDLFTIEDAPKTPKDHLRAFIAMSGANIEEKVRQVFERSNDDILERVFHPDHFNGQTRCDPFDLIRYSKISEHGFEFVTTCNFGQLLHKYVDQLANGGGLRAAYFDLSRLKLDQVAFRHVLNFMRQVRMHRCGLTARPEPLDRNSEAEIGVEEKEMNDRISECLEKLEIDAHLY